MAEGSIQEEAESHQAQGSFSPTFEDPECSEEEEEEESLPPKRSMAMMPCDFDCLLPLPPKRQVAMEARHFEAISMVDPDFRNFLSTVRLADDEDEDADSSEVQIQPQQKASPQNQVEQRQGGLSTKSKESGKPWSTSHWAKMKSRMWLALGRVPSSDTSRAISLRKVCPEASGS
eukprot:TRINITY_DN10530_c0_g2_i1.p1 TRINITY_DN10530_c0_g2~~TRINITY_DN10530_c0_g2_i1.p1  ORF type:complete len:196 (+),score=37.44 TRINITY_DN10530_c0_g2_i1:65-589(+)